MLRKKRKDVNSDSLIASGSDAFNDVLLSISVAISAIIFMVFNISLEAYVSVILSLFIIKSGLELINLLTIYLVLELKAIYRRK